MANNELSQIRSPCYCIQIRQISREVSEYYENALIPSELKITQYSLLCLLWKTGSLTMNQLSEVLKLDRTTLIRNLKVLENKGFVLSASQKGSRANLIQITDAGEQVLVVAHPLWEQAQSSFNDLLTADELNSLDSILKKIIISRKDTIT